MKYILSVLIIITISNLNAISFIPSNNSTLNYRQIEFSWPQIPNSNNYKITITDINSDFNLLINNNNNILIYNGYDFDWGKSYSWQVCGFDYNNLIECHNMKYFTINNLPSINGNIDLIPPVIDIQYLDMNQVNNDLTIISGYYQSASVGIGIDRNGNILWFSAHKQNFGFLRNGNFISRGDPGLFELSLNGDFIFQSPNLGFHHDMSKTDNNTYFGLVTVQQAYDCPPIDCPPLIEMLFPDGISWKGDKILELNQNGEIIWEWNTFDYIGADNYNSHYINILTNTNLTVDWTHCNEVFYEAEENVVYLSIRNLNTITKINYETKEIVWHLGDLDILNNNSYFNEHPSFNHQHTPIRLDNGNFLVFNNGTYNSPQVSSCQEYSIDDNSFNLIWEYTLPDTLYTLARGECHRMDNGQTLIGTGQSSNFIMLNTDDEIIWHGVIKSALDLGVSTMARIESIPNLYPSSFNIEFDNYSGSLESSYIDIYDNNFYLDLINNGWMDDQYEVNITDNNNFQFNANLNVNSNSLGSVVVDVSEIININNQNQSLDIDIYSFNKNEHYNYTGTLIHAELAGDLNNDNELNIFDIIALVYVFLDDNSQYNSTNDLNDDGIINVVDIVALVNIILEL